MDEFPKACLAEALSQGVRDWGMGAGVVCGVAFRAAAQQCEVLGLKIWLSVRIYTCV